VLGRDDLGAVAPGKRADLAIWDLRGIEAAGAWDPVAALILCGPLRVKHLVVEGRPVVRDGQMMTLDLPRLLDRQRQLATRLAG
jgi:cytosine/adenosine deaminase-related metal-dependent hydrolase